VKDPFNAAGAYSDDRGGSHASELGALVRSSESFGQFKTPSLRNVALTAPYMHQGQFATLRDVLHYYSTLEGAVPAGHHGEQVIRPLHFTPRESVDILAFLQTLTDAELPRVLVSPPSSPLSSGPGANPR
jgi:cytochrome c peroxidase